MTVAYLINTYPSGSHTFIRREIRALERGGTPVVRIAMRGWREQLVDQQDREEQGRTHYVLRDGLLGIAGSLLRQLVQRPLRLAAAAATCMRMSSLSDRSVLHHLVYLAEACRVVDYARRAGVSHLHAHFGTNSTEVAMLARVLGGPRYSFTVHGPEEFDKPQALHLREKVEHAEFVVAVSSFGRSQMFRWLPYTEWGKVRVVHCGLEQEFHAGQIPAPPPSPRLVCVGRLSEQKGQLLLLEAAHELVRRGACFELVLAGDGELRPELERQIAAKGLQGCVRITGWLSSAQVREQIVSSRALVLASFAEGLPVVIMEAMALGRPVVTTSVAGIPELVRDGHDGWLVPAGDSRSLVRALEAVLSAPQERLAQMGKSARQRVLARHCADAGALRLSRFFRRSP